MADPVVMGDDPPDRVGTLRNMRSPTTLYKDFLMALLALLRALLPLIFFFAGLLCACASLPHCAQRYRLATSTHEKWYFALRFFASWCFVYGVSLFVILMIDTAWDLGIAEHWPTLAFVVIDWDMLHHDSLRVDMFISLLLPVPVGMAASIFGSEDEICGTYRAPERAQAREHIDDVMARYKSVLLSNPSTSSAEFYALPISVQIRMTNEYRARLADIEERVRTVHQIWHKRGPI